MKASEIAAVSFITGYVVMSYKHSHVFANCGDGGIGSTDEIRQFTSRAGPADAGSGTREGVAKPACGRRRSGPALGPGAPGGPSARLSDNWRLRTINRRKGNLSGGRQTRRPSQSGGIRCPRRAEHISRRRRPDDTTTALRAVAASHQVTASIRRKIYSQRARQRGKPGEVQRVR
jgi:hypothetical protein